MEILRMFTGLDAVMVEPDGQVTLQHATLGACMIGSALQLQVQVLLYIGGKIQGL